MCKCRAEGVREQLQLSEEPATSADEAQSTLQPGPAWMDHAAAGLGQPLSGFCKAPQSKSASGTPRSSQVVQDHSYTGAMFAISQESLVRKRTPLWPGSSASCHDVETGAGEGHGHDRPAHSRSGPPSQAGSAAPEPSCGSSVTYLYDGDDDSDDDMLARLEAKYGIRL